MLIPCPHCGERELEEFTYLGDATKVRPPLDAPEADWCDYLFMRENPMGAHREHWHHSAGCRSLLVVERNTLTHAVAGATLAGAWGMPVAARTVEEPAE